MNKTNYEQTYYEQNNKFLKKRPLHLSHTRQVD